ncbi:MAG: protein kinase [Planctomycetes bacterium]|nr:protein kinase [Planctomycetota bacterium]
MTEHGAAPEAERARAEVQTIASVLRPLCPRAADSLERMALVGRWRGCGGVSALLHEARDRELSGSMPERWRLATGPALPVDDLWPLLAPRHRLPDLASWLQICAPERQDEARDAVRLHVEALEPAEVAIERLGVPADRARQAREQILALLDAGGPTDELSRAVTANANAWESLRPRLMGLKERARVSARTVERAPSQGLAPSEYSRARIEDALATCHWASDTALGAALRAVFATLKNEEEDELAAVCRADDSVHRARDLLARLLARTVDRRQGRQRAACVIGLTSMAIGWHSTAAAKLRSLTPSQLVGLPPDLLELRAACVADVIDRREVGDVPHPQVQAQLQEQLADLATVLVQSDESGPGGPTERKSDQEGRTRAGPGASLTFDSLLGRGAFGEVWSGRDQIRDLAIKLFHGGDQATLAIEHARALAKVDHENIVKVHFIDFAVHPATGEVVPCVACELVEGETLGEWLEQRARSNDPLPLAEARRIGLAIIDGVAHIHARDTVHGDLHNGNVMIAGETVKVIDLYSAGSLRLLSSIPRHMRVHADVTDLSGLCHELLLSVRDAEAARLAFGSAVFGRRCSLAEVRTAFDEACRRTGDAPDGATAAAAAAVQPANDAPSQDAVEVLHALTRSRSPARGGYRVKVLTRGSACFVVSLGGDRVDIDRDPRQIARFDAAARSLERFGLLEVHDTVDGRPTKGRVTLEGWNRSDALSDRMTYWWSPPPATT